MSLIGLIDVITETYFVNVGRGHMKCNNYTKVHIILIITVY